MEQITVNASINLKEQPQTLSVNGSFKVYRDDDVIEVTKAKIDGINPTILILDLKVIEGQGPMKGILKPFNYQSTDDLIKNYNQVTIRYGNDDSITVNIEVFG